MFEYASTDRFKKDYRKLDPRQKEIVKKKMRKIVENPDFGKPLHSPLQNFRSERIENLRIVYTKKGESVEFGWIDDRGHVYG